MLSARQFVKQKRKRQRDIATTVKQVLFKVLFTRKTQNYLLKQSIFKKKCLLPFGLLKRLFQEPTRLRPNP